MYLKRLTLSRLSFQHQPQAVTRETCFFTSRDCMVVPDCSLGAPSFKNLFRHSHVWLPANVVIGYRKKALGIFLFAIFQPLSNNVVSQTLFRVQKHDFLRRLTHLSKGGFRKKALGIFLSSNFQTPSNYAVSQTLFWTKKHDFLRQLTHDKQVFM